MADEQASANPVALNPVLALMAKMDIFNPLAMFASLSNRAGGLDSLLFMALWAKLILRAVNDGNTTISICLRERDFSYFAVEEWLAKLKQVLQVGKIQEFLTTPESILFGGEIPCLYLISATTGSSRAASDAAICDSPPAEFLALVDFVAKTTGSGLAILLKTSERRQTQAATDLRSGVRVRYEITEIASASSSSVATSKGGTSFYWVERAESGKGSSFRAPDSFARRSPRVIVKPGQPGAPKPTRT